MTGSALIDDWVWRGRRVQRECDDYIFNFIQQNVNGYTRAIDIGANIGVYVVFLSDHVALVDAFEPDEDVMRRLHVNLELNHISNVRTHQVCVGRDCGAVLFLRANPTNQGLGKIICGEEGKAQTVDSVNLDQFFGGPVDAPTFIKVDIEGAEWLVLQGCDNSIGGRTARVDMLIEIHPENIHGLGGSVTRLYEILLRLGFDVKAIKPNGLSPLAEDHLDRFWWACDRMTAAR